MEPTQLIAGGVGVGTSDSPFSKVFWASAALRALTCSARRGTTNEVLLREGGFTSSVKEAVEVSRSSGKEDQ